LGKIIILSNGFYGVLIFSPVIIKYPFWAMTASDPDARYTSINKGEAVVPQNILSRSALVDEDIGEALTTVKNI